MKDAGEDDWPCMNSHASTKVNKLEPISSSLKKLQIYTRMGEWYFNISLNKNHSILSPTGLKKVDETSSHCLWKKTACCHFRETGHFFAKKKLLKTFCLLEKQPKRNLQLNSTWKTETTISILYFYLELLPKVAEGWRWRVEREKHRHWHYSPCWGLVIIMKWQSILMQRLKKKRKFGQPNKAEKRYFGTSDKETGQKNVQWRAPSSNRRSSPKDKSFLSPSFPKSNMTKQEKNPSNPSLYCVNSQIPLPLR